MSAQTEPKQTNRSMDDEIQKAMDEAERAVDGGSPASDDEAEAEIVEEPKSTAADEIDGLKKELAATKDRWLRAVADHENYKKRTRRETEEAVQRGVQSLLNDFLPVVDNLDRALAAVAERDEQISAGIKMVRQVFLGALDKNGIIPVPGVGSAFDPAHHDALQQVKSEDYPPGRIVMVFESGFSRHGRLVRPAKVIVSSEESTGTATSDDDAASEDASVDGEA